MSNVVVRGGNFSSKFPLPSVAVTVTLAHHQGRLLRGKPEYEDCKRLALEQRVPIHAIYAAVREALSSQELGSEPVAHSPL